MNKHSPLPWVVRYSDDGDSVEGIYTKEEIEVGNLNSKWKEHIRIVETDSGFYPPRKEDAEFIVEACNAYPSLKQMNGELMAALKEQHGYYVSEYETHNNPHISAECEVCRFISRAEGVSK